MVPRALRMFFEPDLDTAEDAEAAGRVEVYVAPAPEEDAAPHGPMSLVWAKYPSIPVPPKERR